MSHQPVHGTVSESARRVIHVVRVRGRMPDPAELDAIAERMRERLAFRGEVVAEVVMTQGAGKQTLRLFGNPYSVTKVRAAMFNAQLRRTPIELD